MPKFSLGASQALFLLFSQALTLQILFYPLVIANLLKGLPRVLNSKKIVFGFILIFLAAISIVMRGSPIDFTIILLRFYCGIILVTAAFSINKNLQITRVSFWLFILFVFYEYISLTLGLTPFTYANFVNAGIESEVEGRVSLGNSVVRAVGPTMNSSNSGSILAIMFFYILIGSKKFLLFKRKNTLLLLGLFTAFVLCGSATAVGTFLFLLLVHVFNGRVSLAEIFKSNLLQKVIAIFFSLLIFIIISRYILSDYLDGVIATKWNLDYFLEVFTYKLLQINALDTPKTILFGADLTGSSVASAGGDFIISSFVYHFGLIYVLAFVAYLFYICKAESRVFLFAALVSSLHYGTLFTLTGQVFFGALMIGSVFSKELRQNHAKLSDLKNQSAIKVIGSGIS